MNPSELTPPANRCQECRNCKVVSHTQSVLLSAITRSHIPPYNHSHVGEDARLIWNRILEDYPCINPKQPE